jgi:DNA-binding MarR family transcriptional regulator
MMRSQILPAEDIDLGRLPTYQAGIVQASAHRTIQKTCDNILRKYGLTTMQWLLLGTIYTAKGDPLRLTDLANMTGTGLPYITNTLNYLETKKIITRRTNRLDSRSKIIKVTTGFADKFDSIEADLRTHLRERLYETISDAEFKVYIKVLYQLAGSEQLLETNTEPSPFVINNSGDKNV